MKKNITYLQSYTTFVSTYNTNKVKNIDNFKNFINDNVLHKYQYIQINQFLKKINYFLINILPNLFISRNDEKVYCKHWNLAQQHNSDLQENYTIMVNNIHNFDTLSPEIMNYLEHINLYKKAVNYDKYSHNPIVQYNYQKYLFAHILNVYVLNIDNGQKIEVNDSIIKINDSILNILHYHASNQILDYNLIKKRMTQIKQSEKLIKTDYLKQMKNSERQAEKMKMNLKLGIWSFALNAERVYKYSKDFFNEDKKDAMKVQSIAQSTYYEQSDIIDHEEPLMEQMSEEERIINEEGYNMNLIGEDGEHPEEFDGED